MNKRLQLEGLGINLPGLGINLKVNNLKEISPELVSELLQLRKVLHHYYIQLDVDSLLDGEYNDEWEYEEEVENHLYDNWEILFKAFFALEDLLYRSKHYLMLNRETIKSWTSMLEIFDFVRKTKFELENRRIDDDALLVENLKALYEIFNQVKHEVQYNLEQLNNIGEMIG